MDGHLGKPIQIRDLAEAISRFLKSPAAGDRAA